MTETVDDENGSHFNFNDLKMFFQSKQVMGMNGNDENGIYIQKPIRLKNRKNKVISCQEPLTIDFSADSRDESVNNSEGSALIDDHVTSETKSTELKPKPVPLPRFSLMKSKLSENQPNDISTYGTINCDSNASMQAKPRTVYAKLVLTEENTDNNYCKSESPLDKDCESSIKLNGSADNINEANSESGHKAKRKSFSAFLRKSKLLSLRKRSTKSKSKNESQLANNSECEYKRPTRSPPAIPEPIKFRAPALLPEWDHFEEQLYTDAAPNSTESDDYDSIGDNGDSEELYNDAGDEIYSTVDSEMLYDSDLYEGINDYSNYGYTEEDLYQDAKNDSDSLYEVLPCDQMTESEYQNANDLQNTCKKLDKKLQKQQKMRDKKRRHLAIKLNKRFNLTGEEVPVNEGIVKRDSKGSRYDLLVRSGETVLIIRMECNPPGKWLAKNERGKIGYVDLSNISLDPESVKTMMSIASDN